MRSVEPLRFRRALRAGVIWRGDSVIEGVPETLDMLRSLVRLCCLLDGLACFPRQYQSVHEAFDMLRSMVRLNAAGLLQFVAAGNVEGGSRAGPVDMRSLAGRCAACMRHLLPPRAAVASRLAAMLCLLSLLARATGQAAGVCAAAHPAHPLGLQASWITCRLLPSPITAVCPALRT